MNVLWIVTKKFDPFFLQKKSIPLKQLQQIIHRLVKATEKDGQGLILHVALQSVHTQPIKR